VRRAVLVILAVVVVPFACSADESSTQTETGVAQSSSTVGSSSTGYQPDPCSHETCPLCDMRGCCVTWPCEPCDEAESCYACVTCAINSTCGAAFSAWSTHPDSPALGQCIETCCGRGCEAEDLSCVDACVAQYPEVGALWLQAVECFGCDTCVELCSTDPDWAPMLNHYCPGVGGAGGVGGGAGGN
jgi:hypothetical protein